MDPSSGQGKDDFTLSIARMNRKDGLIEVCLVHKICPPFKPSRAIKELCTILKNWGIREVTGDKYAPNYVSEHFQNHGIQYRFSEMTTSELYLETQGLLISGEVSLPDNEELKKQFIALELTVRSGGKDKVDSPSWGKDDLSNSVAGSVVLCKLNPAITAEELEARLPVLIQFKKNKFKSKEELMREIQEVAQKECKKDAQAQGLGIPI